MCRTFAKYLFGFLWYKSFYKKKRVWDLCLLFQNVKKIMIHYVYWSEKAKLTFSFLSKHLQLFLLYKFKNHTSDSHLFVRFRQLTATPTITYFPQYINKNQECRWSEPHTKMAALP